MQQNRTIKEKGKVLGFEEQPNLKIVVLNVSLNLFEFLVLSYLRSSDEVLHLGWNFVGFHDTIDFAGWLRRLRDDAIANASHGSYHTQPMMWTIKEEDK